MNRQFQNFKSFYLKVKSHVDLAVAAGNDQKNVSIENCPKLPIYHNCERLFLKLFYIFLDKKIMTRTECFKLWHHSRRVIEDYPRGN
jgi:hypothetical protein